MSPICRSGGGASVSTVANETEGAAAVEDFVDAPVAVVLDTAASEIAPSSAANKTGREIHARMIEVPTSVRSRRPVDHPAFPLSFHRIQLPMQAFDSKWLTLNVGLRLRCFCLVEQL